MGLGSGSRLHRMRQCLGLPRELWIQIFGKSWSRAVERKGPCLYVCTDGSRRVCGVGACARLLPTKSDPWGTSGPHIDRIPSTRPSRRDRQYRELKKVFFFAPRLGRPDLFKLSRASDQKGGGASFLRAILEIRGSQRRQVCGARAKSAAQKA